MDPRDALELIGLGLRDPEKADLALGHEARHRAPRLLDRDLRVDAMEVVEVDGVDAEPLERGVAGRANVRGAPVPSERERRLVLQDEAALGREEDSLAAARDGAPDEPLVREGTVGVGRVEVIDAEVDRGAEDVDLGLLVDRRIAVGPGETHASEPNRKNRTAGCANLSAPHAQTISGAVSALDPIGSGPSSKGG